MANSLEVRSWKFDERAVEGIHRFPLLNDGQGRGKFFAVKHKAPFGVA
jgi:hypothetical protein